MYDCCGVKGLVRVIGIVEFDLSIKQGARSAAEKNGGKYACRGLDSLPLICICRIIQHPVCIEKEIEIVEADYRFLLRQGPEAILIDKKIHILHAVETST